MHILFFLHKTGPYHHARFTELAKNCKLTVVEILPASSEYDWKTVDDIANYKRVQMRNIDGKELKGRTLLREVQSFFNQFQPEVVITMGWSNRTYMAALYVAKKEGIPAFSMSDSTYEHTRRYLLIEQIKKAIVASFDGFVTAGKRSEKYLLQLGIQPQCIYKPFDVVDNAHFQSQSEVLPDFDYFSPYLLCISRYIPEKNLFTLIEAYHQYLTLHPEEKTVLYIVGSGPLEPLLKARVSQLPHRQIHLYPFVQYNELPPLYHHAKGLILASTSEQWGLAVNEAMAAGIPVLVSKCCGCVDDLVKDGKNGWIMDPTVEGIVATLKKFFSRSPHELREMGRNGQKTIQQFDLKDHKIAVLSMIENAPKKKRRWPKFKKLIVFLRIFL